MQLCLSYRPSMVHTYRHLLHRSHQLIPPFPFLSTTMSCAAKVQAHAKSSLSYLMYLPSLLMVEWGVAAFTSKATHRVGRPPPKVDLHTCKSPSRYLADV